MKKLIIPVGMLLVANSVQAQLTQGENYIQSKTYLDYNGTTPAKTLETVQYFDGLGRPKQIVNVKASPKGRDVVSHIEYDGFGRQVLDFLPVPQAGSMNGAIVPSPLANATQADIYGSEKIYSEKVLENSPLDRIQQQIQVGTAWNNKPVKFGYHAVTVADRVKKFTTATTWENGATQSVLGENWLYTDGQLYKNSVKDEDGNETIEFKNGQGQLILTRKVIATDEYADTYYVYNEFDQLAFVIPPLASIRGDIATNTIKHDELCYQYRYDGRNRLVEKKLPGKGWEYMIYDKQDRLVATQDAELKSKGHWLYTKYDQFGRVAITGIGTGGTRSQEQALADLQNSNNVERLDTVLFNRQGMNVYYGNPDNTYPDSSKWVTLLSLNYYDTIPGYSFEPSVSNVLGEPILTETPSGGRSTKGLPVLSLVKNIEDDNWTKNYTYYDIKGRVIGTYSHNHLAGYTHTESRLDFAGVVKEKITRHKRSRTDAEVEIRERFVYDSQNRLLKHYHQVDTNTEELLADNTYNELGQLVNKKTGNATGTPLQSVDYAYNIRGWQTKVNNPADLGGKLFAYELKYENPADASYAPAKYNGNISEFDWQTSTANYLRRYAYRYDALNRLMDASYREPTATAPLNDAYSEKLTYDLNGNIQTLKRYQPLANTPILIDDLRYQVYEGNRLKKVTDENTNPSGYPTGGNTIGYDLNGNMSDHLDKGITAISYNFLNLPKEVKFAEDNNNLQFLYRADGIKLKKTFIYLATKSGLMMRNDTDYLDGFQYEKEGGGTVTLQFFPTAEGYYNYQKNRYVYNYEDHLGNIRLAYYQSTSVDAVVVDKEINYYPFGMEYEDFQGANTDLQSYTYGYNGKERQKETGWNDYGARMYMPDLGRWSVIDPLAETSRRWSPFAYAFNNPIRFIDPDGMQNQDITFGKSISTDTKNKIVSDLEQETGLTLSVNSDGKLSYNETENMGGSQTARDMLKGAIDNHRTDYQVNLDNTRGTSIQEIQGRGEKIDGQTGYTRVFDLNINTNQIDGFINGTSKSLNPLTMGYGMNTLHEISHKYNNLIDGFIGDDGTEYSATSIYGIQGDNEKKVINVIRTELDNSKEFKLPFGQRKSYSPLDIGGVNFSAFSSEAYSKGPSKVDPKKDLYIKVPRK